MAKVDESKKRVQAVEAAPWGEQSQTHYGYATDEERMAKRGLEDWELVEKIPESQKGVPYWFIAVIVTVLLVAIGLSFPFWGDRPGHPREWINGGFVAALFYIAAASALIYFMVHLYGSTSGGTLDSDKNKERAEDANNAN